MNKYICKGNLTRDPETKQIASGKTICEFGIAVKGWSKDAPPVFWDVTVWEKTAEIAAKFLKKGMPVLIEARVQEDQWDDKATGEKRYKKKLVCEQLHLLGGKQEGESQPYSAGKLPVPPPPLASSDTNGDDLPY